MSRHRQAEANVPGWRGLAASAVCAATFASLSTCPALAGAWTLKAGTGQMIATGLRSTADEAFSGQGGTPASKAFSKTAGSLLLEHGWTDRLTVVGDVEFADEGDASNGYARSGFSHVAAGARLRVFEADGFVASAQVMGRLEDQGGDGLTDIAVEPRLLVGTGLTLAGLPAFVDGQAAYRFRTEGPDEVRLDVTAGIRPWEDWLFLAQSFSTISLGGGHQAYDYHKAQASVVYDLNPRWSLQAGAFATYAGNNALKERGIVSAIWYRY